MDQGHEETARRALPADDVAHAARGPFAAALPTLDMLRGGMLGETTDMQQEALETVERAVHRAFVDSRDLTTLLMMALDRFEPQLASWPVDELVADAIAAASLDGSPTVSLAPQSCAPTIRVDREATTAVLAVLLKRHAGGSTEPACRVDVRIARAEGCEDEVRVRIAAAGSTEDAEEASGAAPEGARTPAGAALLVATKLLEMQGARLRVDGESTTVWFSALDKR